MRTVLLIAAVAGLGVAAWFLVPRGESGRAPRERPAREPAARREAPATAGPAPVDTGALRAALAAGDPVASQDAAAALRRALRTDPAARARAEELLLAADTPRDLRMALAFVLGTIGGSDPVLVEALDRFRDDLDVARCLVFALGAMRDPPDLDSVFGMGHRPWGVMGPGGLGITVRRAVEDRAAQAALVACLGDERAGLREAAVIALRHSTSQAAVRSGLLATLRAEPTDDVAAVLGEALAVWAGRVPAGAEQTAVVNALLSRAADEGLDGYRFRMEDDFRRIALDEAQQATLIEYAQPAHAYATRSFALAALAGAAPAAARPLCEELLAGDAAAPVRDRAAWLLGALAHDDGTVAALAAAARDDAAWNVRYSAVAALGRFLDDTAAAAAIEAATADAAERVANLARQLLDR
jgi:hypothetical protein